MHQHLDTGIDTGNNSCLSHNKIFQYPVNTFSLWSTQKLWYQRPNKITILCDPHHIKIIVLFFNYSINKTGENLHYCEILQAGR